MVTIESVKPTVLDFKTLDAFHKDCGQVFPPTGCYPYKDAGNAEVLYMLLVEEEYKELQEALKGLTEGNTDEGHLSKEGLAEITKEALDCIVVLIGLLKSLGVPVKECWDELNRELASKRLPSGDFLRRSDGKILKPENFKKANIEQVLTTNEEYYKELLDSGYNPIEY